MNTASAKAVTVTGPVDAEQLGVVLPHEHLLWDIRCYLRDETAPSRGPRRRRQKVRAERRGDILFCGDAVEDNLHQDRLAVAIGEATRFKAAGGTTICDLTPKQIGRRPEALRKIAAATGLNIIMGSGNYVAQTWTKRERQASEEQIAWEIVAEFEHGVGQTGIKPGIIGEVGVSDINDELEMRSLRASGYAQRQIGCAMNVHVPIWEKEGHRILSALEKIGVDPSRVVLSHLDITIHDPDYHDSLARRGAYVEYDTFGRDFFRLGGRLQPSDNERIEAVLKQVDRGNAERILLSHDIAFKVALSRWGGFGYAHILEHIVPLLKEMGLSQQLVELLVVENPKRVLCYPQRAKSEGKTNTP